jgi:hypothetical protein
MTEGWNPTIKQWPGMKPYNKTMTGGWNPTIKQIASVVYVLFQVYLVLWTDEFNLR